MRYQDLGPDYYERQASVRRQIAHHIGKLGALGFEVPDHCVGVGGFSVQVGVGIVFGDAPHPVALVPEGGPAGVAVEEARDLRGMAGRGE
jgi:hypothetical protein